MTTHINSLDPDFVSSRGALQARRFSWAMLATLLAFVSIAMVRNILEVEVGSAIDNLLLLLYPLLIGAALWKVQTTPDTSLRDDAMRISDINAFVIRAAFWAVIFVGLVDMALSLLRVEGLLSSVFGERLASELGKAAYRGAYVHMPLILLGIFAATRGKTLGLQWLTLFVVIAELMIVIARFVFSYEQSNMADLVRFWYGALFLFASAYTLLEEGHVRVDVFYAGFKDRTKALVNAFGTLALGLLFCWTILIIGMSGKRSVINSPLFNFEVSQSGFGMYVKYLMAGFLGVFAISMIIQFCAYFLSAVADYRGDPGKYEPTTPGSH